jgi:hypothetical protein
VRQKVIAYAVHDLRIYEMIDVDGGEATSVFSVELRPHGPPLRVSSSGRGWRPLFVMTPIA